MMNLLPMLREGRFPIRPLWDRFEPFFGDLGMQDFFAGDTEWLPKVDVSETENEVIVKAEIPGMDKDDLKISLADGFLTISGEKKKEQEDKTENYRHVESYYGSFSRSMRVPGEVDVDRIDASYKNGVLKITLPKSERSKPRRVEIQG